MTIDKLHKSLEFVKPSGKLWDPIPGTHGLPGCFALSFRIDDPKTIVLKTLKTMELKELMACGIYGCVQAGPGCSRGPQLSNNG